MQALGVAHIQGRGVEYSADAASGWLLRSKAKVLLEPDAVKRFVPMAVTNYYGSNRQNLRTISAVSLMHAW